MRILDLFCKAGGAARGYASAGFEVVGVDIEPQPRYPYDFIRADVLAQDARLLRSFDAVHASPPCQFGTALRHAHNAKKDHVNLIPATRALLAASGLPYVIENVEAVRPHLRDPVRLCGSMFGLGAQGHQLQRHRLFEANWPLTAPAPCDHQQPVIGVYGGHARRRSAAHGGRGTRDEWEGGHTVAASTAMGLTGLTMDELSEAIPPAYTRWIGLRLIEHLEAQLEAA